MYALSVSVRDRRIYLSLSSCSLAFSPTHQAIRVEISQTKHQSFAPILVCCQPDLAGYQDAAMSFKATACFVTSEARSRWIQLHVLGETCSEKGSLTVCAPVYCVVFSACFRRLRQPNLRQIYWFCTLLSSPTENAILHPHL